MKTKIQASNITCGGCAKTIENAFSELGVDQTKVNIESNEILVEHENKTMELVQKLNELGYKARSWQNLEN